MIVKTRNSVYSVEEIGPPRQFVLTKVQDLYPGGHPNVRVGDRFFGSRLRAVVGENLRLGGVTAHEHRWRDCRSGPPYDDLVTTVVVEVAP